MCVRRPVLPKSSQSVHLPQFPLCLSPKSHGMTSFADPHQLTSLDSYRFKKHGGRGVPELSSPTGSRHCRRRDEKSDTATPLVPPVTNCDARKPVRTPPLRAALARIIRSYENCRVSPAPLIKNRRFLRSGAIRSPNRLGSIRSIDADVFGREVAGPVAGGGFARVQIYDQWNVFAKKFVARGALVEIQRLAAA